MDTKPSHSCNAEQPPSDPPPPLTDQDLDDLRDLILGLNSRLALIREVFGDRMYEQDDQIAFKGRSAHGALQLLADTLRVSDCAYEALSELQVRIKESSRGSVA